MGTGTPFDLTFKNFQNAVLYMLVVNNSLLQQILDFQLNGIPNVEDDSKLDEANQKTKDWRATCQEHVWIDLISKYGEPDIILPPDLSKE